MRKSIQHIGTHIYRMGVDLYHTFWKLHSEVDQYIVKQKLINGYQMLVFVNEDVGCHIYCYGAFEKNETRLISRLIKANSVCFDIGANVGYYTLLMASKARKGQVHSFEPVPRNYHLMSTSTLMNGFDNVKLNCCAVGNVDGHADLSVAKDGAYSSFVDTGRMPMKARIRTFVTRLDTYCRENRLEKIDFIKVDVEGAEKLVLDGAETILQNHKLKPKVMMLELYGPMLKQYSSSIGEVVDYLERLAYAPFICAEGRVIPFRKDHHDLIWNVFFAREGSLS